ncbi:hypothetical protein LTR62_002837 [Meristemomyces frigidus]|uniref:Uncharacterized protein n=1 Tax=Meristemomyces frigidus TaxID=1508187 RepID=A0AAN7YJR4_9PEZI|nr:hypothetical protein LTR62_002837 [Meristemomyces frigidus]
MPEPLTIACSVVGLVTATGNLIPALYTMGSTIKNAARLAQDVSSELATTTLILEQLSSYINGVAKAAITELNLITVEQLTATLTDAR